MLLNKLKIENYRGIKELELVLGPTTVLVGENNCGKTTVLHALRACLYTLRSAGRAAPFEEFDLHFDNRAADPTTAPPIVITLTFEEAIAGECLTRWSSGWVATVASSLWYRPMTEAAFNFASVRSTRKTLRKSRPRLSSLTLSAARYL